MGHKQTRAVWWALLAAVLSLTFMAPTASAHVRWFVEDENAPVRRSDIFDGVALLTLVSISIGVSVAWLGARLAARWQLAQRLHGRCTRVLKRFGIPNLVWVYPWLPVVLAVHAAVPLFVSGVHRQLFAPNLGLPYTLPAGVVALAEIVIALSFLAGVLTRPATVLLAALGVLGMVFFGPLLILEHSYIFGIAAFLFITGRGPRAVDRLLRGVGRPKTALLPHALPLLRVLTGLAIVVAGFTEKLWNRDLALAFLQTHPFNVTGALPFGLDDARFIVLAGVLEVTLGALLITGLWTRPVIVLAWVPFNLTVPFLGWEDLLGHLPINGILLVLLLCGAGQGFADYLRLDERTRARVIAIAPPDLAHPRPWTRVWWGNRTRMGQVDHMVITPRDRPGTDPVRLAQQGDVVKDELPEEATALSSR